MGMEKPYRAEHEKMMHKQANERKDFVDRAHKEALGTDAKRDAKKREAEVERVSKIPTSKEKLGREMERIAGQLVHISPEELNKRSIELVVGGKSPRDLIEELNEKNGFYVSTALKSIFKSGWSFEKGRMNEDHSDVFSRVDHPEKMNFVRITPQQLGYIDGNTLSFKGVIGRARTLGLEMCPADAAFLYRYQYSNQPAKERLYMAGDEDGDCFELVNGDNFLEMATVAVDFSHGIHSHVNLDDQFVFRLKLETEKSQE